MFHSYHNDNSNLVLKVEKSEDGGVANMRKNRKIDREEDQSRVKLYKTHRGWFSCLTRFFHLVSFESKEEVHAPSPTDRDEITDKLSDTTAAYLKGLGVLSTILGVGAVGQSAPETVHAAVNTVNQTDSQVVGSGSTTTSTSGSNSTSDSHSTSGSTSGSQSGSMSNSHSGSTSGSQSTSGSTSTSGSQSTSNSGTNSISGTNSASGSNQGSLTSEQASLSVANSISTANSIVMDVQKKLSVNQLSALVNLVQQDGTVYNVSTAAEFANALSKARSTNAQTTATRITINLTKDIDLSSWTSSEYGGLAITGPNTYVTINGNGHTLWFNGSSTSNNIWVNDAAHLTVNDTNFYSANKYGAIYLSNKDAIVKPNNELILNNVNMTGGTVLSSETGANVTNHVILKGKTTFTAVSTYNGPDGSPHNTSFLTVDNQGYTQIYMASGVQIDNGATVTMHANNLTNYNILMKGNEPLTSDGFHVFSIGNNATVTMDGALYGNVLMDQSYWGKVPSNQFTIGDGATVNMTANHFNLGLGSGNWGQQRQEIVTINKAKVNLTVLGDSKTTQGDGNIIFIGTRSGYQPNSGGVTNIVAPKSQGTVTINPGANVVMTAKGNAANIRAYMNTDVTINNPDLVVMSHDKGQHTFAGTIDSGGNKANISAHEYNTNIQINQGQNTYVYGELHNVYTWINQRQQDLNNISNSIVNSSVSDSKLLYNESVSGSDSLLHYSGNYNETHKYSLDGSTSLSNYSNGGSTSLSSYSNFLSDSMSIVNSKSLSIRESVNYSNIDSASNGFITEQSKLTS